MPGLIAWYRFEEQEGALVDSSGHGHHGHAEGSGYARGVPGKVGLGITFHGKDGRVRIPAARTLEFLEVATLEVWVRLAPGGNERPSVEIDHDSGFSVTACCWTSPINCRRRSINWPRSKECRPSYWAALARNCCKRSMRPRRMRTITAHRVRLTRHKKRC